MESKEQWLKLYQLSEEWYSLEPWNFLYESDIFGVKTGNQTYFVSIMGSAGEFTGISAYEGIDALEKYWLLYDREMAESADVLTIPHMLLSFEPDKQFDADQKKRLKEYGYNFRFKQALPELKRVIPGLVPFTPDDVYLGEFNIVLEQAIAVCKKAFRDTEYIYSDGQDDDTYLIMEKGEGQDAKWKSHKRKLKFSKKTMKGNCSREDLDVITALQTGNAVMQANFQMMPFPMKEKDTVPYFPVLALMTNKKNGIVEAHDLLIPLPDYSSLLSKIPQIYAGFIKELGFKPRCIEVCRPEMFDTLSDTLGKCNIHIVFKDRLDTIEEAMDHFINSMQKGT